jgi:hypothetical protein
MGDAFCCRLMSGLTIVVWLYCGHVSYGLTASLGGLVFLYMPATPLEHRMTFTMACGFGLISSYALGLICHLVPAFMTIGLIVIATLVTMTCRFYGLGPPGSMFFIMATAIGLYSPTEFEQIPLQVGLIAMGCILSCTIGFLYSIYILRRMPAKAVQSIPLPSFDFVVIDSVVIGVFVGISLSMAQLLGLDRPYWVPVSCLAVIQGVSLRAAWIRQVHRVIGTILGLLLTWGILLLNLDQLSMSFVMIALIFIIESLILRHYGLAAIFFTPLAIFLAEMATFATKYSDHLIWSRLADTILGCSVGICGAACLHSIILRKHFQKLFSLLRYPRSN